MARTKQTARKSTNPVKKILETKGKIRKMDDSLENVEEVPRCRPGARALEQIKHYQKSTDLLIRKAAFHRVIREIASNLKIDIRFQVDALLAIQVSENPYDK